MPEDVNSQITDAVTQTNVKVLGEAPAQAMATVYQTLAQSTNLAILNSTNTQHNMQMVAGQAAASMVTLILKSVEKLFSGN